MGRFSETQLGSPKRLYRYHMIRLLTRREIIGIFCLIFGRGIRRKVQGSGLVLASSRQARDKLGTSRQRAEKKSVSVLEGSMLHALCLEPFPDVMPL